MAEKTIQSYNDLTPDATTKVYGKKSDDSIGWVPHPLAAAPTAANGSTVDATYGTEESDVIQNLVTRQAEIIAALQAAGLMDT